MYIEMELLARDRYETRLREAESTRRARGLLGPEHRTVRAAPNRPLPRMSRG